MAGRKGRREPPAPRATDGDVLVDVDGVVRPLARGDAATEDDDEAAAPDAAAEVDDDEPAETELVEEDPQALSDEALDRLARPARSAPAGTGRSIARQDPLTAYIQEAKRYPLLDRQEEHDLAVKWAEHGDMDAARQLVTANLRLVVKIAHEYRRAYQNILDLVQEGNVGLMQAVRKYDPYRGVKLSSYAAWWIRAYILKFILNNWRLVKIGTTQAQRKLFFNLRKEKDKLERLGFEPEHKLLAAAMDVTEKEVAEMDQRLSAREASLDAPLGGPDDDGTRTRMDVLEGAVGGRPDVIAESEEFRALLRAKLELFAATLKGRDLEIFRERLLTDAPLTLQDLGDRFGISRERARQLERRILDHLRTFLEQELGSAVDIGALGGEE